jgi:hypothetical protein
MTSVGSFSISLALSIAAVVMVIMGVLGVYRAPQLLIFIAFAALFIASIFMNIALLTH